MSSANQDTIDMNEDEIRKKRLAKLASHSASQNNNPKPVSAIVSSLPSQKSAEVKVSNFQKPAEAKAINSPKKATVEISSPTVTRKSVTSGTPTTPSSAEAKFRSQSHEEWEHDALCYIFHVSLEETQKPYDYLTNLAETLRNEQKPLLITSDVIESIIFERLSLENPKKKLPIFDYLVECWKRCVFVKSKLVNNYQEKSKDDASLRMLVEYRKNLLCNPKGYFNFIVSYSGLVLNDMLEMFPQAEEVVAQGARYLGSKLLMQDVSIVEEQVPKAFLDEFVARFNGDGLEDVPRVQNFNPANTTPKTLEVIPFFGPFFRQISIFAELDPQIGENYFFSNDSTLSDGVELNGFNIGNRNIADVKSSMSVLQNLSFRSQKMLYEVVMLIIKSSPEAKEAILQFLADSINKNRSRGKLQVDKNTVSSDGFMFSVVSLLMFLVEPILDQNFSKLTLIDTKYLHLNSRLIIELDDTRILSEQAQTEQFLKTLKEINDPTSINKPNFISDIFFLTIFAQHYGFLAILRFYQNFVKQIEEFRGQVAVMREKKNSGGFQGPQEAMATMALAKYEKQLDQMISLKLSYDSLITDHQFLKTNLKFYDLVIAFLMRTVFVGCELLTQGPKVDQGFNWFNFFRGDLRSCTSLKTLDLSKLENIKQPDLFFNLPEFIFEDIVEFYLYILRFEKPLFKNTDRNEILTFAMFFLTNSSLVKNPYLKSKLIEILFYFTLPLYKTRTGETIGRLDEVFSTHPFCKEYLVNSVLKFYCDVEQTGMSSQFYDKFNIRYNISQILRAIWPDFLHRQKVIDLSQQDFPFFVKFANLLINDTTYLMDEGLSKLTEIRNVQNEMASPDWESKTQEHKNERLGTLKSAERQAASFVSLGNETVNMLRYLTTEEGIVGPFCDKIIVDKLAAMMNYNLVALVGPKCTELKVSNPEKYRFNPKKSLKNLIQTFMNLSNKAEFVEACALDGRSYNKSLFERAIVILEKNFLIETQDIEKLMVFLNKVETYKSKVEEEEELFGEIPDEFLDQIMSTLMQDPVVLPSGNVLDRSTITKQLLNNPIDPFNRQPMTVDDLVPDLELKARIDEWKRGMKGKRGEPMQLI
ncbi:hypothetical protein HK099_001159 [Clydaea vesicula]|uniref:RING-type E3 ubiquitin transferase n=1 Tax=Clydaea vesicula TaxID=447962 RepID=A0AAD5U592_9FUNG|nr:hypothetical protein HK099_001159 [Clydaea vesicula]